MKNVFCYDDGGKTIDRYTVIYPDGSFVGMSATPFHPQGFCQHGDRSQIERGPHLGKRIKFGELPADCQAVVIADMKED